MPKRTASPYVSASSAKAGAQYTQPACHGACSSTTQAPPSGVSTRVSIAAGVSASVAALSYSGCAVRSHTTARGGASALLVRSPAPLGAYTQPPRPPARTCPATRSKQAQASPSVSRGGISERRKPRSHAGAAHLGVREHDCDEVVHGVHAERLPRETATGAGARSARRLTRQPARGCTTRGWRARGLSTARAARTLSPNETTIMMNAWRSCAKQPARRESATRSQGFRTAQLWRAHM